MATQVEAGVAARTPPRGFMTDQQFFVRYAIVVALFILFGFAQFSMRGFVDIRTVPPLIHLHGAIMVAWLGIFVAQNVLVHRGELALHRKLGWAAAALAVAIAIIGCSVGYQAVAMGRQPPFFTGPFFLALTFLESLTFGAMVAWAISLRRKTQWHRRVMLGAMFLILEPALGRLLPMPLLGAWGEWLVLAVQLGFIAVLARHDQKILGAVHPATKAVAGIIVTKHVLVNIVSRLPFVIATAQAIAAG